jgi:hypothetical protein
VGRITVKVKQLSELLQQEDVPPAATAAAATASSAATSPTAGISQDISSIFGGGGGRDEETFDAMVQRHLFSWNDINPADYTGSVYFWRYSFSVQRWNSSFIGLFLLLVRYR